VAGKVTLRKPSRQVTSLSSDVHFPRSFNLTHLNTASVETGLIIDAFGDLRDQLEQVKEDMEVSRVTNCRLKRANLNRSFRRYLQYLLHFIRELVSVYCKLQ